MPGDLAKWDFNSAGLAGTRDSALLTSFQLKPMLLEHRPHNVNLKFLVQSLGRVRLFVTPWTAAHQASMSITDSQSLLKLMSIQSVMPSSHLIHYHSLLLLPSIFPSIRFFSFLFCLISWRLITLQYRSGFCHTLK